MSKLLLLIFLFPLIGFSQPDSLVKKSKIHFELNSGLNISTLKNDSINFRSGSKPFFGTSLTVKVSQQFNLKGVANFALKGSHSGGLKVENQYLDLLILSGFRVFSDFYFQTGIVYSQILESNRIKFNGDNWSGIEKENIVGYHSEFNFLAGFEFKLQDNINLNISYTIPSQEFSTSNFQIGLSFALNNRIHGEKSYRRIRREASKTQIKQLKSSILLVRLKTSENAINALLQAGDIEKASRLKLSQETENLKIVTAFKSNFHFCKVRYFYSNNSDKVKQRQFKGILLNDDFKVDNSIALDSNELPMIAEFSYIEQDTAKFLSHYSYEQNVTGEMIKVANYYSPSSNISFYALRILDHNFVQLNKPFPFYTRAMYKTIRMHPEQLLFFLPVYVMFLHWSYSETVALMDGKLEKYFGKNK